MGLLDWLRGTDLLEDRTAAPTGEQRSLPPAENEVPLWGPAYSSGNVTPLGALAIADVWSAVRCLTDAASSLPLHAYRKSDDGGRERVASGKLVELLDRPGPATTQADLISTLMGHLLIFGDCYLAKYRERGEVAQLGVLQPDRVRVVAERGRVRFEYSPPTGRHLVLTDADVVHIKGLSIDGVSGLSAVQQAGRVLGLSDQLVKHALEFFDTGRGLPTAVFKMPAESTEEQRQRVAEMTRNEMVKRGVLVIEGDGEFEATTLKLDDSQFAEQRRLAAQEVARVFRIPSHFLNAGTGGDSLTYSTAESMSIDFVKYSLAPWLRRIELAITHDRDLCFQA